MEQNQAQMEERQITLDGKMSKVLLSTNDNAIAFVDLKTMIMDFMGKNVNLIVNPFNLKSILKQHPTPITNSLQVEPTLNITRRMLPPIGDGARLTTNFGVDNGGENLVTKSKDKTKGID
jgi:hypothetical protein